MLLLQLLCCYCYSHVEFCYNCCYERVIAIARREGETATLKLLLLTSFAGIATANALSILRLPGDTATLKLLLLTSFAAVAIPIAYADASVARVALVTVFKVTCCCYRNCYDANCYYERVCRCCAYPQTLLRCQCYC